MKKKYRQFYEEYKIKLFRYLMLRCGDYELSRDLMQESFTRHYQSSRNSTDLSPAFLFTIARNAFVDHLRHKNNFSLIQSYAPLPPQGLEEGFILQDECQVVTEALKKLSQEDRDILAMVVSSLSYRQIAEILGLSEANIKVRVHRARMRLKDCIDNGEQR